MLNDYVEYLKIPYKHQGRSFDGTDCFGLLRLFYEKELGILLPDFTGDYAEEWCAEHNYFAELYDKFGFEKTTGALYGDVIFLRNTTTRVGHIGVILDDVYFLHMTREGSAISSYFSGAWQRQTAGFYRYTRLETV